MSLKTLTIAFTLLVTPFVSSAQGIKITRNFSIECAGVTLAGMAITPRDQRDEFRRVLNFYTSVMSVLDTNAAPHEAAMVAGEAAHESSKRFLDSITSKTSSEDEKTAAVAKMKHVMENCVAAFKAHIDGLTASASRQR